MEEGSDEGGRHCALWIMAALERSCEPDVPACQQQLCIIGCLPHVNACLLSPFARRPSATPFDVSLSLSLLRLDGPCVDRRSFPSPVTTYGQIYGLVHYNKQRRSNEPSLTVKYRFRRMQRSSGSTIGAVRHDATHRSPSSGEESSIFPRSHVANRASIILGIIRCLCLLLTAAILRRRDRRTA